MRFNERKATQAAAFLLRLRGGRMSCLKLIKLLYLADREALLRWGRPITTDHPVSMDRGPVLSRVYELIDREPQPGTDLSFWQTYVIRKDWNVELQGNPADDELSEMEERLLSEIYSEHGRKNRWKLVEETHQLPEWSDPCGSSTPIRFRDILKAGAKSDAEIAEIAELEDEWKSISIVEQLANR